MNIKIPAPSKRNTIKRVSRNSLILFLSLSLPTSHFCAPTNYISMIEMWNILLVKLLLTDEDDEEWKHLHVYGTEMEQDLNDQINKSHENTLNARNQNQKNSKQRLMMGPYRERKTVFSPLFSSIAGVLTSFFIDLLMKHTTRRRENPTLALTHSFHVHRQHEKFINFIREGKRNNEWVSVEFSVKKSSRCAGLFGSYVKSKLF